MDQIAQGRDETGEFRLPTEADKVRQISALLDIVPVALYVCDGAGLLVRHNERAAHLWGWSCLEDDRQVSCNASNGGVGEGRGFPPDGGAAREAIRSGEPVRDHQFVVNRPDGSQAELIASAEPVFHEDGTIVGAVGCLQDFTERRQDDPPQKRLLNELNHRVKNTLATVQLLAGLTIRKSGVPKGVQDDFEGRLIALSRAHDHVTKERWAPVDLHDIVETAVEPYREQGSENVDIRGERITVGPQPSLTLAMIFHELASNAAKFGALSSPQGRLSVSWSVANGVRAPTLIINWRESGGPPVSEPERQGFGSRLLQHGIAHQFKGSTRLDYDPSGLRCTMEIPLPSTPE